MADCELELELFVFSTFVKSNVRRDLWAIYVMKTVKSNDVNE